MLVRMLTEDRRERILKEGKDESEEGQTSGALCSRRRARCERTQPLVSWVLSFDSYNAARQRPSLRFSAYFIPFSVRPHLPIPVVGHVALLHQLVQGLGE